jgi:dihydropyrimidine dehydrogenase (NAD+) subunit PreT
VSAEPAWEVPEKLFGEIHPPLNDREAFVESDLCLECGSPLLPAPCVRACPTGIDIPGFIRAIREGRPEEAARTIFEANVLGGTCARVCPVEVLCEGACVLAREGRRPVAIGRLQRYATDHVLFAQAPVPLPPGSAVGRGRVAVIGAGPAGLSCAAELARFGHQVTVFEERSVPGGLVTFGVAPYKQVYEPLPREVAAIAALGVEFRFGVRVGRDITPEELETQFDAVFLGVGLGRDLPADLPGEDLAGVWNSLDFVEAVKTGRLTALEGRVVVIGGGNTAIDVAREAVRLGAEGVVVVYRRTEDYMPAYRHEVAAARREGVRFEFLTAPVRIIGSGYASRVECVRMRLGPPDPSGRPRPEPIPGSNFVIEARTIVKAIGQAPRTGWLSALGLDLKNGLVVVDGQFRTSREKYFAGGDCINGGGTVVEAVQHGKLAARAIHAYIQSRRGLPAAAPMGTVDVSPTVEQEADVVRHAVGELQLVVRRRLCKGCELCVKSCPEGVLKLDGRQKVYVEDIGRCIFCGICQVRCPDFAIWVDRGERDLARERARLEHRAGVLR